MRIKCQCSDLLSLVSVLAVFTENVLLPLEACDDACNAVLALVDVVELIEITKRTSVQPHALLAAVHRYLELYVPVFGFEWLAPKDHWLLHLAETLAELGLLLNCFVLERKHKVAKRYANDLTNTSKQPSKSLISEAICHHFCLLSRDGVFNFDVGLINGKRASAELRKLIIQTLAFEGDDPADVYVSNESRINPMEVCSVSDVVLVKEGDGFAAGRIELHCSIGGVALSLVQMMELVVARPNAGYTVWKPLATAADWYETGDVLIAVAYSELPDGNFIVYLPKDFR